MELLDPDRLNDEVLDFDTQMKANIRGQDRAIEAFVGLYQLYLTGLAQENGPIGSLLFLGPTGCGKTRVTEAAAEILFGRSQGLIKVDCGEFQHSHEVSKLIGSPPGYLGHLETTPSFTQKRLEAHYKGGRTFTFILFDEIEKASSALWDLLLGILDRATLTLGDNTRVDFSKCIIVMTSNLGSREMAELISGRMGFAHVPVKTEPNESLGKKIYRTGLEAAKKKFPPEFMNRFDKVVVFRPLNKECLREIVQIELNRFKVSLHDRYVLIFTETAEEFLVEEGTDLRYGARELRRAINRFVRKPLARIISTRQVKFGDLVTVNWVKGDPRLRFLKKDQDAIVSSSKFQTRGNS